MCGGRFVIEARLFAEVSPVRTPTRISGKLASCARISASGSSRFFWMSLASALSGEMYKT